MRQWQVAPNVPNAKTTTHTSLVDAMSHVMQLAKDYAEVVLTSPDGDDVYVIRQLDLT